MDFKKQYKHPKWQKKRLEILDRDKFTCQLCGSGINQLHVHHLKYPKNNCFIWDIDNKHLITLCDICHNNIHIIKSENTTIGRCIIDNTGMSEFDLLKIAYKIIKEYKDE